PMNLLLSPNGGAPFMYAGTGSVPLVFPRAPDGALEPYQFCGTFNRDLTTLPGNIRPDVLWSSSDGGSVFHSSSDPPSQWLFDARYGPLSQNPPHLSTFFT